MLAGEKLNEFSTYFKLFFILMAGAGIKESLGGFRKIWKNPRTRKKFENPLKKIKIEENFRKFRKF